MSSFYKDTMHPITRKIEEALWIDDYFGNHRYGIEFKSDGRIFKYRDIEIKNEMSHDKA